MKVRCLCPILGLVFVINFLAIPAQAASCEDMRSAAAQAEDLANRGISLEQARQTISKPEFNKLIDVVYSGDDAYERNRQVRDIYAMCQDKRAGVPYKSRWTKEDFRRHFQKACVQTLDGYAKSGKKADLNCDCFANMLIGKASDSDLDLARENSEHINKMVLDNLPKLSAQCGSR